MTFPIEWKEQPFRKLTVSKTAVIGKGTLEDVKEYLNLSDKKISESTIPIRLTESDLGNSPYTGLPIKIGQSYYNTRYILQILEELFDKDLLMSDGRRVKKKYFGNIIWVKAIAVKEEMMPIIFYKDKDSAYVLAPRKAPEDDE